MNTNSYFFRFLKRLLPTRIFLKWQYYVKVGIKLNLENPVGLDEKIQWLKIHYKKEILKDLVDKYSVREYIKKTIGDKYLNELYGVYNNFEEIAPDKLPDQFVVKCTHGSGMILFCSDKENFDWKYAKKMFRKWMKINWYYYGREWAYKHIKPRIICEKSLLDRNGNPPMDYKFYCFHGEPKFIELVKRKENSENRNFYDMDWSKIQVHDGKPNIDGNISPPKNLNTMIDLAKKLSNEFVFVRVDLYSLNDSDIVFGELTFYPGRGLEPFQPKEYEIIFGKYLNLDLVEHN